MADTQAKIVLTAEDRTARIFAGLRANLGGLQSQVNATKLGFAGLAGALSVAGVSAFFGRVVDGIDNLNDLADATGSSVEKLSGLEDIGARTGTSVDTVSSAIIKLNKNLLEAQDPTSQAAALFKQLGLDAQELSKADPSDALLRVATALNGFEQNANKGQFQLALLGKSTRELAPFLKDLAEAGEINATVTSQQAAEAETFNKQLFQLQKNATDAARALVSELLPKINAIDEGSAKAMGGFSLLDAAIRGIAISFETTAVLGLNLGFVLTSLGREAGAIAAQLAALGRLDFKGFTAISEAVKEDGVRARAELDKLTAQILGTAGKAAGAAAGAAGAAARPDIGKLAGSSGGGRTGRTAAEKDRLTDAQKYLENLQRQLQGTQDLSVAETVLADIQAGRLKLAKGESAQPLLDIAAQIDQAKRREDQLKAEAEQVRQLRAENERLAQAGASVFEATRTPAEAFGRELGNIQELLQKGAIDSDTYYRRVAQLREEFDKLESAKDTISELDSFTQRAAQNIQDALGESLADVLDGNFKSIGDNFAKLLNRMVAEAAAAQISRALFGDLVNGGKDGKGSGGSSDSGLLGGLLKSAAQGLGGFGSSLLGSIRGGAATGSNLLERDMITLVHKGEAIVPKAYNPAAGGAGGRALSVTINQSFAANASRQTTLQAAADAQRALQAAARNL